MSDVRIVHPQLAEVREDIVPLSEVKEEGGIATCPRCSGIDTKHGYGCAGGGFGPYLWCDTCGSVVAKTSEDAEESL